MTKLTSILCASLLLSAAAACKKDEDGDKAAKTTTDQPKIEPKKPEPPPPPPGPKTPEERVAVYEKCWAGYNDKKWDEFKACYSDTSEVTELDSGAPPSTGADAAVEHAKMYATAFPDTKGEPQLILAHENHVVGVWLVTGTHQAPLTGPGGEIPATNKKVGLLVAQGVELDDAGKVSKEWLVYDGTALMGQLGLLPKGVPFRPAMEKGGEKKVVIAKGDETEQKNADAYKAATDAFNKHDLKAVEAAYTKDAVFSENTMVKDQNVKQMIAGLKAFWAGFPDMQLAIDSVWGAGDYTVAMGKWSGTNTGVYKPMKLKKTGKKVEGSYVEITEWKEGKQARTWLFMNGMATAKQLGLIPEAGAKPADKGAAAPADKGAAAPADKPAKKKAPKKEAAPEEEVKADEPTE